MAQITEKEFYKGMDELKSLINTENQKTREAISGVKIDLAKFAARSADNKEEIDRLRDHSDETDKQIRAELNKRTIIVAVVSGIALIGAAILPILLMNFLATGGGMP